MQPADIFKSQSLGTCVLYFRTLEVLEEMAVLKGDVALAERCTGTAAWLREAINTYFWQEEKGYYGQYLYGRDAPLLSQRNETLAQALCILWDAADSRHAALAARNVPSVDFGTPCFFPNIAGAPSYYNDAVWPFVQAYWMLASAKAANEEGVLHSIGSIYRSALLFLANYENMNCDNGDWFTTETNSPRMPGSLAGNLSVVYRLLFGIRFDADGMHFSPFVPWTMKASRRLENFRYRDAVLDIRMKGFGDRITSFRVDGKEHQPFIPATLTGRHTIEIRLASESAADSGINLVKSAYMPSTPVVKLDSTQLIWQRDERCHYFVLRDGKIIAQTDSGSFALPEPRYGSWQVIAATNEDNRSFASEPITLYSSSEHYQVEDFCASATYPYSGYEGRGFAEISPKENPRIVIPIRIEQAGEYVLQWRYASSNPVTRINDSPLRAMTVGDAESYYVVFPLRNNNSGNDWGYSNGITVCFEPGAHTIVLEYPSDAKGMCLMPDQVMLDCLILSKKS
jgi:Neutral trehalase